MTQSFLTLPLRDPSTSICSMPQTQRYPRAEPSPAAGTSLISSSSAQLAVPAPQPRRQRVYAPVVSAIVVAARAPHFVRSRSIWALAVVSPLALAACGDVEAENPNANLSNATIPSPSGTYFT